MKLGASVSNETMDYSTAMRCLANEFSFTDVVSVIKKSFPGLSASIKDSTTAMQRLFDSNSEYESNNDFTTKKDKELIASIGHLSMANIGVKMVTVPEGFKGHLVDYINILYYSLNELNGMKFDSIDSFSTALSTFISNKDVRVANKDLTHSYAKIESAQTNIKASMTKYFNHNLGKSKAKLVDVLPRMNDVPILINYIRQLEGIFNKTDLASYKNSATQCSSKLDIIISMISDNSISEVSRASANNIAKGAYQVGLYLELLSTCYYNARVAITCVEELINALRSEASV